MLEFIQALGNPAVPFLRYALIAGVLSSAAFGIVGTYITVRRITYLAGAIAHSVLAGIGLSLYLREAHGVEWLSPILGAMVAAVVAGGIIGYVSMHAKEREDTVIGAVWATGMALGLLLISRTPGYVDPMSYLFGNILILSQRDLVLIAVLDVIVISAGLLGYNQFQAVAFDEEFARVRGLPTSALFFAMILMTALSIVLLTTIVGLIMVIALFTLPAAVGAMLARRMWMVMLLATIFTMVFTTVGLGLSYTYDLPSGPTIIAFAGVVYLIATGIKSLTARAGN